MNQPPSPPTLFLDTQALIYALEKEEPPWLDFLNVRLASGFRLVLTEETLHEFARSGTLEAALELTRRAMALKPIWIRNFADLEVEELHFFLATAKESVGPIRSPIFVEDFTFVSQLTERHKLSPEQFVEYAFDPRALGGLEEIAQRHAEVLNFLSRAVADGRFTAEIDAQARKAKVKALLSRGTDLVPPLAGVELESAVKFSIKHYKWMLRECPAYATEHHLANYRTSNPNRKARTSDSMDLLLSTSAFPYVSTFVTNDGFLHGGLVYAKKNLPHIQTELLRTPPHAA
jgi:hypothetical protein